MSLLHWDDCENYVLGFFIGSEGENGEHLRDFNQGWPYSVYRRCHDDVLGITDVVICNGIQNYTDARKILDRLQALA